MIHAKTARSARGTTLLEISAALTLVAIALSLGLRGVGALLDRSAVVSARESGLALVHRARAEAVRHGGTRLVLDREEEWAALLSSSGDTLTVESFGAARVDLEFSGTADQVTLAWSALGWGMVASRTLEFIRGGDTARLVISSRGRGTRR